MADLVAICREAREDDPQQWPSIISSIFDTQRDENSRRALLEVVDKTPVTVIRCAAMDRFAEIWREEFERGITRIGFLRIVQCVNIANLFAKISNTMSNNDEVRTVATLWYSYFKQRYEGLIKDLVPFTTGRSSSGDIPNLVPLSYAASSSAARQGDGPRVRGGNVVLSSDGPRIHGDKTSADDAPGIEIDLLSWLKELED